MNYIDRAKIEQSEEWMKWAKEIPVIHFQSKWKVKIIPPFAGAIVRFHVDYKDKHVSVYLDCYDKLGCFGEPYWELYPYDDDVYRVEMGNIDVLLEKITEVLES